MNTTSTATENPVTESAAAENLRHVQQVVGEVFGSGDLGALERILADGFVHHRPDSSRTREEWVAGLRESLAGAPGMQVEVQHLLTDGDHVVMHSRRLLPGGASITGIDIWRFDDGRIAEAWEILEPAAESAAHLRWWQPAEG
ncbi:nuclear transport factor 2 family protein [Krasilnikoviella flava]|uniref:Predicted SnoaL-like aldol condensation-catalyzing enzyme n=1 Tax=Krasilnikoviella flava TaxID=526729 RepID=A0A1T5LAN2_9MICO|nr:nuclear transport factor 2 family protein [Krasilnikoviella flava]SKC72478.1 Predicted SnoaL-like aldol condensation-catalyzing enzyme [Krasilnikoviella flava]